MKYLIFILLISCGNSCGDNIEITPFCSEVGCPNNQTSKGFNLFCSKDGECACPQDDTDNIHNSIVRCIRDP
jgi:hypothetical protein